MNTFKLALIAAALTVSPLVHAAGKIVQMPLSEERVYGKTQKDCFYATEINLGDVANAKPYQLLVATDENRLEEMRYSQHLEFNVNKELILKLSSFLTRDADVACPTSLEVLLLN